MSVLDPTPPEELLADLSRRIHEAARQANDEILEEKERSRQRCDDRWRRLEEELRPLRAQKDALLKAMAQAAGHARPVPLVVNKQD